MGLYTSSGTRRTLSAVVKSTHSDPIIVLGEDLYERIPYHYEKGADYDSDAKTEGGQLVLWKKSGAEMRQSELTKKYPTARIDTVTPATGSTAGGTVVTIKGANLDGTTAVTFGGTAGTSLTIVSPSELRVTTPAKTAGAYNVAGTDDSGAIPAKTNAFTYA